MATYQQVFQTVFELKKIAILFLVPLILRAIESV